MELSYIFLKKFFLYFGKGIFRTLACLELEVYSECETYSEHCETSTMKCFAKNSYLAHFPASALNFFPKKPTLKNFLIFPEIETPKNSLKPSSHSIKLFYSQQASVFHLFSRACICSLDSI